MAKQNASLISLILCIILLFVSSGTTLENKGISYYDLRSIDESLIPCIGENYSEVIELISTNPDNFHLDSPEEFYYNKGTIENGIQILGLEYEPYIYINDNILQGILFAAGFHSIDDAIPELKKLVHELNTLYGSPTYSQSSSANLTVYLENGEITEPLSNQSLALMETWTVRDNFNGDEDTEIQVKLLFHGGRDDHDYYSQFKYAVNFIYETASIAYRRPYSYQPE